MESANSRAVFGRLQRLSRNLQVAADWFAAPRYAIAARTGSLFLKGFSLTEIFGLALVDPHLDARALREYVSKESIWPVYERFNRTPAQRLIDDKLEFQQTCERLGLPVPRLLHVYRPRTDKASADGNIASAEALRGLPERFVAKPSLGLKGYGVLIVQREANTFRTHDGRVFDAAGLLFELDKVESVTTIHPDLYPGSEQCVLFQEMESADIALAGLSGTSAIQCVRMCTVLDSDDQPHILFAFLKVITGRNVVDNFDRGKTGNLLAFLDGKTGRILRVIGCPAHSSVARTYERHPTTDAPLIGFCVPHWDQVCELAARAAVAFKPVGTVGWDIALTARGPVLIEGNTAWDPVSPFYVEYAKVAQWANERQPKLAAKLGDPLRAVAKQGSIPPASGV